MVEDNCIQDHLDDFTKILDDLDNIKVKVEDEDKVVMLLNALLESIKSVKDAMIFDKTIITLDEVESSVKTKDLQRKMELTRK